MTRIRPAQVFLFALLSALASRATLACDFSGKNVAELDIMQLLDAYAGFQCIGKRDAISRELHERLAFGEMLSEQPPGEIRQLRFQLEFDQLRRALHALDRKATDAALLEIDRLSTLERERFAATAKDHEQEYDATREFGTRVADIRKIIDGVTPPPMPGRLETIPDWTLHFGFCGTPAMSFYRKHTLLPDIEDAWAAVARDDLAVSHLLESQWVEAMNFGMVPPRLREFAMRMLGEDGYKREIEVALKGIRIDDLGGSRVAHIPLLGHWLPLPLAIAPYRAPALQPFSSTDALAEWLSAKLLAARDP